MTNTASQLRQAVASAFIRSKSDSASYSTVMVHRGTLAVSERAVVIGEQFCLLPAAYEIGLWQRVSGAYYPVSAVSFHGLILKRNPFGDAEELIALFDSV